MCWHWCPVRHSRTGTPIPSVGAMAPIAPCLAASEAGTRGTEAGGVLGHRVRSRGQGCRVTLAARSRGGVTAILGAAAGPLSCVQVWPGGATGG